MFEQVKRTAESYSHEARDPASVEVRSGCRLSYHAGYTRLSLYREDRNAIVVCLHSDVTTICLWNIKTNTKIRYFLRICRLRILFKTGDKIKIELAEPTLKQTGVLKTVKDSPCRPVLHHFITACRRIRIAAELSSFFILSFCHVCIRIVRRHARSVVLYSNPAATVALGCRQSLPRLWWWLGAHKWWNWKQCDPGNRYK